MKKLRITVCVILIVLISGIMLTACNLPSVINNGLLGRITDDNSPTDTNDGNNNNTGNNLGGSLKGAANLANIILQTKLPNANDTRTLPDVIEDIQDSVVVINVTVTEGTSAGSGVIVAIAPTEGYSYLITCLHVVESHTKIEVILTNGNKYNAEFVGGLPDSDIALLRINVTSGITVASIRNVASKPIRTGEDAIAIGNPLGTLGGTVTKGIISATTREINIEGSVMTLLQTDASINSGNSGGGLFDANGLLIGIVNAKSVGTSVEGLGYAIPIEKAVDISQNILNTRGNTQYNGLGYVQGKKMLGITTQSGTFNIGGNNIFASKITLIAPYGSASSAGLAVDDYIVKVDGVALSESRNLGAVLAQKNIGDTVTLTIMRRDAAQGIFSQNKFTEITKSITLKQYVYGFNQ